jgi:hypothetical protein
MNHQERFELHRDAMTRKYGLIFPIYMTKEELKTHCMLIDLSESNQATLRTTYI